MTNTSSVPVNGSCDERFAAVGDVFASQLDAHADLGSSVAITLEGETIVDLWGGWKDPERTATWDHDTITNVWSTTKTMTALCALVLADRGELDVYAPVSRYWPEFAQNDKGHIEVRHLLSHTSGVSAWEPPITMDDVYDPDRSAAMLASQAPWWEPGTASGYHTFNYGHLIGEVVRRVTGQTLGDFFAAEIAGPLDADFHIGLNPRDFPRVSNVIAPPPTKVDFGPLGGKEGVAFRTFTGPVVRAEFAHEDQWRQAEIGAANGHGNARSVARIQTAIANGGISNGVELLSPKTIDLIFDQQSSGTDLVLDEPFTFGIGYALADAHSLERIGGEGRVCYWGGWGGSMIIIDVDRRMTFAYVMNRMQDGILGNASSAKLAAAAFAALGDVS